MFVVEADTQEEAWGKVNSIEFPPSSLPTGVAVGPIGEPEEVTYDGEE
jgi:hypothetical protein